MCTFLLKFPTEICVLDWSLTSCTFDYINGFRHQFQKYKNTSSSIQKFFAVVLLSLPTVSSFFKYPKSSFNKICWLEFRLSWILIQVKIGKNTQKCLYSLMRRMFLTYNFVLMSGRMLKKIYHVDFWHKLRLSNWLVNYKFMT